jgi:hypothetical protein
MRPSFFGFETGEPRKFRNLPDEKIGKISVIFAPLKKYAPDVLSASDGS